jgi:hypothetical protein
MQYAWQEQQKQALPLTVLTDALPHDAIRPLVHCDVKTNNPQPYRTLNPHDNKQTPDSKHCLAHLRDPILSMLCEVQQFSYTHKPTNTHNLCDISQQTNQSKHCPAHLCDSLPVHPEALDVPVAAADGTLKPVRDGVSSARHTRHHHSVITIVMFQTRHHCFCMRRRKLLPIAKAHSFAESLGPTVYDRT